MENGESKLNNPVKRYTLYGNTKSTCSAHLQKELIEIQTSLRTLRYRY